MDKIIGLGGAGRRLARAFKKYPQYDVYEIDVVESSEPNYFKIEKQDSSENYEKIVQTLQNSLKMFLAMYFLYYQEPHIFRGLL